MIHKVLIANRGEIAVRVMRSCREMGIRTVAVFSEADRTARHVLYADEACLIGPAASRESYLNIDKIIMAAKRHGVDAIHPGYGFLSENSEFARRCRQEGIIFIGPDPETMDAMGDKISARKHMIAAGVPVVPGTEQPLQSVEEAKEICNKIGYPVMLKASMGGGGKGMRLIHSEDEVEEAYNTARSESMSSFGDDTVYLEKFVEEPHHIEFQILGDNFGNAVHLFERECSIQRRNQKIVEETPSPFVTPELRQKMGEAAVAAAKAVHYKGAGTIEFLVDKGGISVGSLFLAGYVPGALLAASLMVGSYIISVKRNYPKGDKFSMKNLLKQLSVSFWALAAVLIVVFGVVGGVFTATESAAVAVIYSLIVSVFIYKGLDWKGVWRVLGECVDTLSIVLILIATSSIFGYCLTRLHVPDLAAQAIVGLTDNPILIALLLNLILLVLGCIMDMAPIILIATPILLPIATSIGIDPIQFGIMVVLNCGIGLLTPPVGAVLFIGSAVAKIPMEKVVKATLPFYLCMIITLLLITFVPGISLWLPSVFAH